jgi:pyruvate/2-oxoglutarate dehydrogenase complex dihydrolipoamide acyltransferase (E2) component
MSQTLLRLLDTAGQRPLTDDEYETMKDVAVLGVLCAYFEQALQPCAVCGVFRDLHRQWRVFVDEPFTLAAHQFTPRPAEAPDGRPAEAPALAAPVAATAQAAPAQAATAQAAKTEAPAAQAAIASTARPAGADPGSDAGSGDAADRGRRSWRRALGLRLGIGQRRPLSQP